MEAVAILLLIADSDFKSLKKKKSHFKIWNVLNMNIALSVLVCAAIYIFFFNITSRNGPKSLFLWNNNNKNK